MNFFGSNVFKRSDEADLTSFGKRLDDRNKAYIHYQEQKPFKGGYMRDQEIVSIEHPDFVADARNELKQHADDMESGGDPSYNGRINRAFEDHFLAPMANRQATWEDYTVKTRYKGAPAITRTGAPKSYTIMPNGRRGRGRRGRGGRRAPARTIKNEVKREVKKIVRKRTQPIVSKAMVRAIGRDAQVFRRYGQRGRTRVITAPVASGGMYQGSAIRLNPSLRGRLNCAHVRTRAYLGAINKNSVTGNTSWVSNIGDNGGQWYFMPTNANYWQNSSPIVTTARMYQYYYLNSAAIELESYLTPGNTNNFKTYFASFQDPNLYIEQTSSLSSTAQVGSGLILSLPLNSCSFPTWVSRKLCVIPPKFFRGARYETRTYALNAPLDFTKAAENKQAVAFGIWITIGGPIPLATTPMYDVFIIMDCDFCEMVPTQNFDNEGGITLGNTPVGSAIATIKHQERALSTQLEELHRKMNEFKLVQDDEPEVVKVDKTDVDTYIPFSKYKETMVKYSQQSADDDVKSVGSGRSRKG